jgi:endonuclease/exonuclease/phosphatase family metal-dependent hydrolase
MNCDILTYNTHGLPWSRDTSKDIVGWIRDTKPPIVCLQEVFCIASRLYYKEQLARIGYTVSLPNDLDITFLPSGLLIAALDSQYKILSECFCSFQDYHNVEWLSNKGFHVVRLRHSSGRTIRIANTHTQSNTEISWWFGSTASNIRKKQFEQMLKYFSFTKDPVLIAGDMNCEESPHSHLRFLHPLDRGAMHTKHTFYSTGEDLDHIGWIPLQWAKPGCHHCDINRLGPQMTSCQVFQKPWSDHAPVLASIYIPDHVIVPESYT